ncbi:hypothetical protein [Brevibacillus reuszeri]|uniref:hypothetical protein n=1 Tax=Brevibacillus reuszeri TaxID=54915 RepID=UPI003D2092BD
MLRRSGEEALHFLGSNEFMVIFLGACLYHLAESGPEMGALPERGSLLFRVFTAIVVVATLLDYLVYTWYLRSLDETLLDKAKPQRYKELFKRKND